MGGESQGPGSPGRAGREASGGDELALSTAAGPTEEAELLAKVRARVAERLAKLAAVKQRKTGCSEAEAWSASLRWLAGEMGMDARLLAHDPERLGMEYSWWALEIMLPPHGCNPKPWTEFRLKVNGILLADMRAHEDRYVILWRRWAIDHRLQLEQWTAVPKREGKGERETHYYVGRPGLAYPLPPEPCEREGCSSQAELILGNPAKWMLCEACAGEPEFNRFRVRLRMSEESMPGIRCSSLDQVLELLKSGRVEPSDVLRFPPSNVSAKCNAPATADA